MIERIVLAVFISLLLFCAGIGLVVVVYIWLVWYISEHLEVAPPPPLKPGKQQGLSEADLRRLPTVECSNVEATSGAAAAVAGAECAVCLDMFQSGQRCRLIPVCGHSFHVQCADAWLSKRGVCPICRRIAVENNCNENKDENKGGGIVSDLAITVD